MTKSISCLLLAILLLGCTKKVQISDPIPKHDSFTIDSELVQETRVLNVWTPPTYDGTNSFPVLYMPDGGIKEDFPHIANTIAKLVENKSIPPIILVGIENTDRRRDLSGFSEVEEDAKYCPLTDGATNFRAFITNELIPEINRKYHTTKEKGLLGESLAGLFVMETCLLEPQLFDFYIAMDPSIWWNNHYLEREAHTYLQAFPDKKVKLWFAGSGAEDISKYTNKLAATLTDRAPQSLSWTYSDEPKEKHSTIFRATKEKALIWTLNESE